MARTASATRLGSAQSSGAGRPVWISQKPQERVQVSPIMRKVAVPWPPALGDVGTLRFLADGVEGFGAHEFTDALVDGAGGGADLDPGRATARVGPGPAARRHLIARSPAGYFRASSIRTMDAPRFDCFDYTGGGADVQLSRGRRCLRRLWRLCQTAGPQRKRGRPSCAVLLIVFGLAAALVVVREAARLAANLAHVAGGAPGSMLHASDFAGATRDLDLFEGRLSAQLVDGALQQLGVREAGELVYAATGPQFGDFDLQVEARPLAGPLDNAYGVLFRLREPAARAAVADTGDSRAGAASVTRSFW